MDIVNVLETFGLPVAVAMAFGFFIWKQNNYIQKDLTKDIHNKFNRLESIVIKLIDANKKQQINFKGIEKSYEGIIEIMSKLSGNGLSDKFNKKK